MPQKIFSYQLTLLTTFLLLSCSGGDSDQAAFFDSDFDYQSAPTTHQVSFDNIYQPRKMRAIGDYMLVDEYQNQIAFHVLETGGSGDLDYRNTDENLGQGPGEFQLVDDFSPQHLGTAWYSQSVTHPDEDLIYLFSINADFIEKYSTDGTLITRVQGSEFPLPKMRLETQSGQPWPVDDGGKAAYVWVDSDADHIYALYSGNMRSEENALYTNKVHVFNWDLELIEGYKLDHKTHMIAADGHGGIYSLDTEEEGAFIRYIELEN